MNKNLKIIIVISILPIITLLGFFAVIGLNNALARVPETACLEESINQDETNSLASLFLATDQCIEGLSFTGYQQGSGGTEKDFVISAEKLETKSPRFGIFRVNLGKVIELKQPRITLYKDNHPYKYISAKNGILDPVNKKIELDGKEFSIGGEK